MSNYFCINKSGKSVLVYSDSDEKNKIGTIYNREAFGYNSNWGGDGYLSSFVIPRAPFPMASSLIPLMVL